MFTLSNFLSFIRAPLALFFLQKNVALRLTAILIAMFTDSIDGYFARKSKSASRFGAILDPAMDKFFVYFALTVLFLEGNLKLWQALTFFSRDFALCIYGFYLLLSKQLSSIELKPIRWGKITTAMQFVILLGLSLRFQFSFYIYDLLILMGILAFFELIQKRSTQT